MDRVRRLAVIGDVHAEDERLATALSAIVQLDVCAIACTGDIIDGRGAAGRCCELLLQFNVECVRGNHDRWLFTGILREQRRGTDCDAMLPEHIAFLRNLRVTREFAFDGGLGLLCHGIGFNDLAKITRYDTESSLRQNRFIADIRQQDRYRLLVNGHSHERLVTRFPDLTIANAGTLCEDDPGFLIVDFPANALQWHALTGVPTAVADRQPIFAETPRR